MKPPVPYFGGKMTIGPTIAALLPAHTHYVEPYAGSLAVLFAKPPSVHETANDLDQALVTFWRVLRERPGDLARACALTPHSRAEYDRAVSLDATEELEAARQVFVKLTQGRSGGVRRTNWRHFVNPEGCATGMPGYLDGYVDRMASAVERLKNVSLECRPALEVIEKYGRHPNVLLYVDPPYPGSTRSGWDNTYRHEMRDDESHRELAQSLHRCRSAVVVSGYPSDLYDLELFAGWDRHTIAASTSQGGTSTARTEVIWSNRPLNLHPTLFDIPEGAA